MQRKVIQNKKRLESHALMEMHFKERLDHLRELNGQAREEMLHN